MKKEILFYVGMIILYIAYNQFFPVADERLHTIINLAFASFLFLFMGYVAWLALKRMKNKKQTEK